MEQSGLNDRIHDLLDSLDVDDVQALTQAGQKIRQWIIDTPFQSEFEQAIKSAFETLSENNDEFSFAVRSSATAEDMPDASFAGQQETFLNVRGLDNVMEAIKHVFASLFNDRAISTEFKAMTTGCYFRRAFSVWYVVIFRPRALCSVLIPEGFEYLSSLLRPLDWVKCRQGA